MQQLATQPTTHRAQVTMRAALYSEYGLPADVLSPEDIPVPTIEPDQVLVRVHASSVNARDWRLITGTPFIAKLDGGLRRPTTRNIPGDDIAGTVVAVGTDVDGFSVGDEVFGMPLGGGFAEYVALKPSLLAPKPANLSMEETATLGTAALTALQGLRDWGGLQPGQSVLINGASGGVGTFAVQIARALGASKVTAVVSPRHFDIMEKLGVDQVIDYTRDDFTLEAETHDLVFDNAGMNTGAEVGRVVADRGAHVMVTGPMKRFFGPVRRMAWSAIRSLGKRRRFVGGKTARADKDDLMVLREMAEQGQLRPIMDRRWSLEEAVAALEYQGEGHARGKSVVVVS